MLAREIAVLLGAHNINRPIEAGKSIFSAKTILLHDKYNPNTVDYDGDIALIKLAEPVHFTTYIRPVCLPDYESTRIVSGTVVGWGAHDNTNIPSDYPRKIEIPILDPRDCIRKNRELATIFGRSMFCAGKDGSGVCEGDSGSGFYVKNNGKFHLRGIVSSSTRKECEDTNYALYSDVPDYMEFISQVRNSFK